MILAQNIFTVRVLYTNQDLSQKINGLRIKDASLDCYVFDRSLYGSDTQFLQFLKDYIPKQYLQPSGTVLQIQVIQNGMVINL